MEKIEVGEIFTISDENDQEEEVEVLATVDIDGIGYIAVCFVEDVQEDSEEDIDIFFLKVDEDGDLSALESDEEFDKVSAAFEEVFEEEDLED
ncbi:DUF1292 domain-containing protein [Schinkia azotoformans]|uniref:DUF1292 domain-containing protein n=1 Tax=Schinkia azotoformans TaxID=1454 RepID=UPI002DC04F0A|nr:DUF1292 domain-containing protein [Schinkia azotoformans]MEC1697895.1 DUF1292 domain-containing protein [Schinkia azotoformans]MEC1717165.1 DUF1292 domain-containing protein [Schinkia azotoformans]MEC1725123.1 DUF1292 domain-containing protein [Schinkia azotoformans]MEC1741979.1 DUF1292 domain-containing protein [Schinkia azotoformans]MEC1747347.1 DUF1292 domain-containing protein [Schinkia azotoformans]